MGWAADTVWWHVHPMSFVGAEPRALPDDAPVVHRLRLLEDWVTHVRELGADGLLLGPVFASETHGYDTVDHLRVDRRLGDEADLRRLVDTWHGAGMRVVLDGVFNHVGRGSVPFRDVLAHGRASAWADWFVLHGDGPGHELGYDHFEGHRHLPELDHDEPAVEEHVVTVMRHWLDRGIDGWRLDAAYAVPRPFWRRVLDRVRESHPDAWFVGEVIHGPYARWVEEGGLDAVTQYELWKAVWSALNDRNLHELAWSLRRHAELVERCTPMTFVGNHDVTRIASRLRDRRHLEHAVVVLLTLPGTPSIYAGDEVALTGVKEDREGGDDAVRPSFAAGPEALPVDGAETLRHHRRLLALRRRHPGLATGRLAVLEVTNTALAYRVDGDEDTVVVMLNLDDAPHRFESGARTLTSVTAVEGAAVEADPWAVAGGGWAVVTGR